MSKDDLYPLYEKTFQKMKTLHPEADEDRIEQQTLFCLVQKGYTLTELHPALNHRFMAAHDLSPEEMEAVNFYAGKVMEPINTLLEQATRENVDLAGKALVDALEADQNRYADTAAESPYGLYRKGRILTTLAVEEGFSMDAVEKAAEKNPDFQLTSDEKAILYPGVARAAHAYQRICQQDLSSDQAESEEDLYRKSAKHYMDENHRRVLSQTDEIHITHALFRELREVYQKQLPATEEGQRALKAILDEEVWPFLHRCVVKGSPNCLSPGRDAKEYAASVIAGAKTISLRTPGRSSYYRAIEAYTQGLQNGKSQYDAIRKEMVPYRTDLLTTKKLLSEKVPPEDLRRVIAEKSPIARMPEYANIAAQSRGPMGHRMGGPTAFAKWVINLALLLLDREKKIAYSEPKSLIEDGLTYQQLLMRGITSNHLYQRAYQEYWMLYPSSRQDFFYSTADLAVASHLLSKYPDYDRSALEESIRECSPGAILPEAGETYAKDIVQKAGEGLKSIQALRKDREDFRLRYQQARGYAAAGIHDHNAAMDRYLDGKTALYFLRQNEPESDIRPLLIASCPKELGLSPELYADDILRRSKEVLKRETALSYGQSHSDFMDLDDRMRYVSAAKPYYERKGFADSNMDVAVYEDMVLHGMPKDTVKKTIQENSPKAAEPGRSESTYADYIERRATRQIEEAKRRLKEYQVIPHMDSPDIMQDFRQQRQNMQEFVRLPLGEALDEKITDAYLDEGIEDKKIVEALNENTDTVNLKEVSYGQEILNRVRKKREKEAKKKEAVHTAPTKEQEMVRTRAIETSS